MRHMWCLTEPQAVLPSVEYLIVREYTRRTNGIVVHADERLNQTADRLCMWRHAKPLIQCATFVGFEMAERDPSKRGRIEDTPDRLTHKWEHLSHAGVKQ